MEHLQALDFAGLTEGGKLDGVVEGDLAGEDSAWGGEEGREGGRAVSCGHDAEDGGGMLLRFGLGPRALAGKFTGDAVAGRGDELLWMERLRGVREERA